MKKTDSISSNFAGFNSVCLAVNRGVLLVVEYQIREPKRKFSFFDTVN